MKRMGKRFYGHVSRHPVPSAQRLSAVDTPAKSSQRDLRIDTLRGLLLVIIAVNHFGMSLSEEWWAIRFTWQPLGYVSAAEGFVFLAGFVFAKVYMPYCNDLTLLWQKARQRAFDIYMYHLALILGVAFCAMVIPAYRTAWIKWLAPYHATPLSSTVASISFLHQPPYLDILPMYAVFVLCSPLFMVMLFRRQAAGLLTGSVALWGIGMIFDPMEVATRFFAPGHRPAYFNLLSWQLLYILGLYIGDRVRRNEPIRFLSYAPVMGLIVCGAGILFLARQHILLPEITIGLGRPRLEWLRLLNFLFLAAIIGSLLTKIPPRSHIPWLTFLGEHSLQVFSFHVGLLYLLAPMTEGIARTANTMWFALFLISIVVYLRFPAFVHSRYKEWVLASAKYAPTP